MKNYFGIHPSALIGENVTIGQNVTIGAKSIVYDNVVIGDDTFIGPDCIIGEPNVAIHDLRDSYINPVLQIGAGSLIRSGSIIYAGSTLGENFECGHRVTIRESAQIGHTFVLERCPTFRDIAASETMPAFTAMSMSATRVRSRTTYGSSLTLF